MGITSSGVICDVCGKYILPLDPEERINPFSVRGIEKRLYCDNACKKILIDCGKNWKRLPDGPLKRAFENFENKREKKNEKNFQKKKAKMVESD